MSNINEAPSTGDSNMSLQRIPCRNIYFRYFILKNDAFDGRNGDATNNDEVFGEDALTNIYYRLLFAYKNRYITAVVHK